MQRKANNTPRFLPGINIPDKFKGDAVTEQIARIAEVGFAGFFTLFEPLFIEQWANAAARAGVQYQSIHAPFLDAGLLWQEGEAGEHLTRELIDCVTHCARFGIPITVLHAFIDFVDCPHPAQIGFDRHARVLEAADRLGVTVAFENLVRADALAALMAHFRDVPCCKFCYDSGHEHCFNTGHDMLALYGDRLCHTHLSDNFGATDLTLPPHLTPYHDLHLVPGDGAIDFGDVISRLGRTDYTGLVCCEVKLRNVTDRHDHDRYIQMKTEDFYALVLERARAILSSAHTPSLL